MQRLRHIILFMIFSLLITGLAMAQRINFGLYATDGLVLTGIVSELDFNARKTIILAGDDPISILLSDDAAAALTITGRPDLDVTVTIDAPATLDLMSGQTTYSIPFSLGFAYSNLNSVTTESAKSQAIQVPAGFTTAVFPIWRRADGGPPGPPPTPDHTGYVQPADKTAYLFIYGTLGPVPGDSPVGLYEGEINITVSYSTYN